MAKHPTEIELRLLTDKGKKEVVIEKSASVQAIQATMESLDWNEFHLVILSKNDHDSISVGGSLHKDGLACAYEENGEQYVIDEAPTSVGQMTEMLVSYFKGDGAFKRKYKFSGEADDIKQKEEDQKKFEVWKAGFLVQQKKDRLQHFKRIAIILLLLATIWTGLYLWYSGEWQFIGQETAFTKAEIVNTQFHHIGRGKYIQIATYAFEYGNETYTGTYEIWTRPGMQTIGNFIKVKFSTSHPNRSKKVGIYRRKWRPSGMHLHSFLSNETIEGNVIMSAQARWA